MQPNKASQFLFSLLKRGISGIEPLNQLARFGALLVCGLEWIIASFSAMAAYVAHHSRHPLIQGKETELFNWSVPTIPGEFY
jgi:hypothetical protein